MKKRWLLNLILLLVVSGLVAFLYLRPKPGTETETTYEVTNYKMAEFNAINIEFPTKAPVSFEKINGYWQLTAPYKARADQPSVQRILGIIAAKTESKIQSNDLEKYGLQNPLIKLKLSRSKDDVEYFLFGTYNPVTDEQYVMHENVIYLLPNSYSEAAATQVIEMVDKAPLKPTEKVAGFDFSRLEQWEDSRLQVDLIDGQWKVSVAKAKPQQNELNEWLDFFWLQARAKSVELYTPDRKATYPSFEVKLRDGSKVHFDKIQESPELILARPDEGIMYHFPPDAGFTMLNPPINLQEEKTK
jgi:hypothetical protein